jgi:hypothetical protein
MTKDDKLLRDDDPLLTAADCVADLKAAGLPISLSWFEKLCASDEGGPPIATHWGRRPMRRRSDVRAWAENRLRKARETPRPTAGHELRGAA